MELEKRSGRSISLDFARLWAGNTASGVATWALPFVLGLIVLEGSLSAEMLGIVLAVRTAGFLVAVPVAGVIADRAGPRRVILLSGLLAASGMMLTVIGFLGSGYLAAFGILCGALLAGIGQGACRPAYQAIVPQVVAPDGLQAANAAMTLSVRITSLVGPAAATAMAVAFGSKPALLVVAALWMISAFAPPFRSDINRERTAARRSVGLADFRRELMEGLREARRHPWFVAGLIALTCVISTGYSVTAVLLPIVSKEFDSPMLMTATVTAYTLGALIGAVILTRWKPLNIGWTALVGLALYGLVPLGLLVPSNIVIPIAAYFAAGVAIEIFNVPWFTSVQREVPADKLSRVSSIDFLVSYGLAPLGLALMAPAAATFGVERVLVVSALICIAVPLATMAVSSTRHFSVRSPRNGSD